MFRLTHDCLKWHITMSERVMAAWRGKGNMRLVCQSEVRIHISQTQTVCPKITPDTSERPSASKPLRNHCSLSYSINKLFLSSGWLLNNSGRCAGRWRLAVSQNNLGSGGNIRLSTGHNMSFNVKTWSCACMVPCSLTLWEILFERRT